MRLTGFRSIAISSVLIATSAIAATRPHYGGTLHIAMGSAIVSLDSTDPNNAPTIAQRNLLALLFDTLVSLDSRGVPQPALSTSWHAEPGNQRWQFVLRPGVMFSDGTPLTPEVVAASLRRANPNWKIVPQETVIIIELDLASAYLPAELALPRNAIAKSQGGTIIGTGPFVVTDWEAGKKLTLTARDDYWAGRSLLDSVEIMMNKSLRDETVAYDLGQAQVIEVPPDQVRRATAAREVRAAQPVELMALLFARDALSAEEQRQRQTLALSIDRNSLNQVVLQGGAELSGTPLPNWLTGYGFLFPVTADLSRAQQLRAQLPQAPLWKLAFDSNDPIARLVAERIVLNAGDAGLRLQLTNQGPADIRLVRVPLASLEPHIALTELARSLALPPPRFLGNTSDDLYHAEAAILQSGRIIPLLHLRAAWAVSKNVRGWEEIPDGSWQIPDVWLAPGKP